MSAVSLRSCGNCHRRKVRCDKQIPCGRCRQANVECIQTRSKPPRWPHTSASSASASASANPGAEVLYRRLEAIEKLIGSSKNVPASASHQSRPAHAEPGRDLSSNFWVHIDQELGSLREGILQYAGVQKENATAEAHTPRVPSAAHVVGAESTAIDRHAFMLPTVAHNHAVHDLLPMVSQMPFLVEVYAERVHFITGIPHLPSLEALLRRRKSAPPGNRSAEDALVFAVSYTAVSSMDEQEVFTSFNQSQHELAQRYRRGLELSLARADFLNEPTYILLEALTIFLTLARQPSKYIHILTGMAIHMARYLGYHRDGSGAKGTTPFQAEMQRRLWWNLCALDLRASEDQGTELTILAGSFSTELPSNINEADIWPEMEQPPQQRPGLTPVTLLRMCSRIARTTQQLMAATSTDTMDDRVQRLSALAQELELDYFALPDAKRHIAYTAATGTFRVFLGRLTLMAFLPALLASPNKEHSDAIRTKLLVAAIEMLEHHHALCSESSCQPWKWVYKTQQHWHAVVYMLIEICRSPWSPIMERAWQSLQSPWLVPAQTSTYKTSTVWVPLKQLMVRARMHREAESKRLQADPSAAAELEQKEGDQALSFSSSATFPAYFNEADLRMKWRHMVGLAADITGEANSHQENTMGRSTLATSTGFGIATYQSQGQQPLTTAGNPNNHVPYKPPYSPFSLISVLGVEQETAMQTELHEDAPMYDNDDILDFDWNAWLESTRNI